jgi:PKHD-type hydroxylase
MILRVPFRETSSTLTPEEIERIIQMGESRLEKAKIAPEEGKTENHRDSHIAWFRREPSTEFFYTKLLQMIYLQNVNNGWNFDYDVIEDLQFTKYSTDQHYNWHADQMSVPYQTGDKMLLGKTRKISFSVLLNDDYEGGEFEFETGLPHHENRIITLTPKVGNAIVFPSFTYHRVKPVTKGIRYSLVGWICGTPFR